MTIPNSTTNIGYDAFFNCYDITNLTFGNGIISISDGAFDGCLRLTSVTIPKSVTEIGLQAFEFCDLDQVFFQGNAPNVNGGPGSANYTAFDKNPGTVYYVPGTSGWGTNYGGLPTAQWFQPQPQILDSSDGLGATSNGFQFVISWATNGSVIVQASSNLQTWVPLTTNMLVNGTNLFTDSNWTNYLQRFYRVSSQ